MAGGSKVEFEKLRATNIMEFWALFDLWRSDVKKEIEHIKNSKHGGRR